MDSRIKQDALMLAKGLNVVLMIGMAALLVLSLGLGAALAYVSMNKAQTLVPPTLTQPVTVSPTKVDGAYLSQMATYFIWLKMNVSPESVVPQYAQILRYVDSEAYHVIEPEFAKQANYIQQQKISSAYFIENTQVDVKGLRVRFTGTLKQYALGVALPEVKHARYVVAMAYHAGRLTITAITKLPNTPDKAD